MKTHIDHLVVAAQNLEQGVQWCETTLGITPAAGGSHALFGTHNRLFKIATPANPMAYLEIIAIEPGAKGPANPNAKRWFDLDDATLKTAIAIEPQLVHFVVNTQDIAAALSALKAQGIDRGPAQTASRHTRKGVLQWQISVREDGQRLFNGTLPTLIQWGKSGDAEPLRLHPRNSLPRSGISLKNIAVSHPNAAKLQTAYSAIGLMGVEVSEGLANIVATLQTPKGLVQLHSRGV
jgi:hypothetical protein